MSTKIWAFLVAVWKIICWFNGKEKAKQERKESGSKLVKEGLNESDISKITAGFDDINNA